jgi:hypothetical protein
VSNQTQVLEARDDTNCTKMQKSKKKHTEETMPTAVVPDLHLSNISFSTDVIKDLEAKLRAKYDYDLSQYKQANENYSKLLKKRQPKISISRSFRN